MKKKVLSILKILSSLFFLLGFLLLIPLMIAYFYKEPMLSYKAFIYSSIISFGSGIFLILITRKTTIKLNLASSMLLTALAWISISFVGGLPFVFGLQKSIIDSFFEAVSGFTTTGITVFEGLDTMAHSIIFWRSLIQFLGGLGILTFFLFITFNADGEIWQLFSAESHKISSSRPVPNVFKTIKIFWGIYFLLTAIEAILLILFKMPIFDSIIHSFTTLSTGGFSNHDASIGFYKMAGYTNYRIYEYIITFFMFLGGVNFLVHFKVLTGSPKFLLNDVEFKAFVKLMALFIFIILIGIYAIQPLTLSTFEETFRKTTFQVVSVMTTTGFGTQAIGSDFFPSIGKQIFILLMVIGGCVGSTAGGIKVIRAVVLNKLFTRELRKNFYPKHSVLPVKINKTILADEEVTKIPSLVYGWLLLIIIGAGITALFSDLDAFQSFSGMASAVGNIGPFYFSVNQMASLSPMIKLTYIIGMLAGRLELIPIFLLFNKNAWK